MEISLVWIICFPLSFFALIWFFPSSSIVFVCFSKAFPKGERINLDCSIICFWLEGNISSPVRYSYLLIFADDKVDILAAYLLISYQSFSSLIWSSIVMILLYIYFKRFFLNLKRSFDGKDVSLTKSWKGIWFWSSMVHFW